jgi:CheY-like chemotaxis protein
VPQTLLLADDSVTIQRVIELTFADEAITVVAVSDGDQAIERIEADPPDIVLVDIGMPGRTGYEVAQHIKQSPRLKHIPVLLLTGAFEPVDQAKAAAAGCDGVLAKPFEPQLVIARVKELLGRSADGAASVGPVVGNSAPSLSPESSGSPGSPLDSWGTPTSPSAEHKGDVPPSEQAARLDDYFDQLDAAFQTLGNARAEPPELPAAASPVADIIDWFGGRPAPSGPAPDLALSTAGVEPQREPEPVPEREFVSEPEPEFEHEPESEREPEHTPHADAVTPTSPRFVSEPARQKTTVARMHEPVSPPATLPPIALAFAAILAAEQHEPMPALWPQWTTSTPSTPSTPASNGGGAPSEDVLEEITRRVLDRLSDRVVRETVEGVISSIAERLVREEIDRIKSSIK